MKENIGASTGTGEMPKALRANRDIKARARDVSIIGPYNKEFKKALSEVHVVVAELRQEAAGWLQEKLTPLREYLGALVDKELEQAYFVGFDRLIQKYYKLFKAENPSQDTADILIKLTERAYLEQIIKAYTFEFIRSLQKSKRLKIAPKSALELAMLSYYHDPDIIVKLSQRFPDFDANVIQRAVIGHPSNSVNYLENVQASIPKLLEQFPEFPPHLITRVAVGWSEPSQFLEDARKAVPILMEKYPEFSENAIRAVIVGNGGKADVFLGQTQLKVAKLIKEFPEFTPSTIRDLAISNSKDTAKLLETARERIPALAAKFPDLDQHYISRTALDKPKETQESFLESVVRDTGELKKAFPDLSTKFIRSVVFSRTNKAKIFLETLRQRIHELTQQFPDFPYWVIRDASVSYTDKKAAVFLESVKLKLVTLAAGFPDFTPAERLIAAVGRPTDSEGFLTNARKRIPELVKKFADLNPSVIKTAVFNYASKDQEAYLERVRSAGLDATVAEEEPIT